VVAHEPKILLTQAVEWQVRSTPWKLPKEVAAALGALFRATENSGVGAAHGDCAPWNLLSSGGSWVLVDWESATASAPPFHDLFHYLVQSHVLLGRPRADAILAGLTGNGWIGVAVRGYAHAANLPFTQAIDHLVSYLLSEPAGQGSDLQLERPAPDTRHRLLAAAEQWADHHALRPSSGP